MMVIMCEEKENNFKKLRKIDILIKSIVKYIIDHLMWDILKSEYVK